MGKSREYVFICRPISRSLELCISPALCAPRILVKMHRSHESAGDFPGINFPPRWRDNKKRRRNAVCELLLCYGIEKSGVCVHIMHVKLLFALCCSAFNLPPSVLFLATLSRRESERINLNARERVCAR